LEKIYSIKRAMT